VCELSSSTHLRGAQEGGPGRPVITISRRSSWAFVLSPVPKCEGPGAPTHDVRANVGPGPGHPPPRLLCFPRSPSARDWGHPFMTLEPTSARDLGHPPPGFLCFPRSPSARDRGHPLMTLEPTSARDLGHPPALDVECQNTGPFEWLPTIKPPALPEDTYSAISA
jgi:hypothetical protein